MSNRQLRRQNKTRAILEAALSIVMKEGLEGLTMSRLAKQMDAAVGAMYRYYNGKNALLIAMHLESLRVMKEFYLERDAIAVAGSEDLEEDLSAMIRIIAMCTGFAAFAQQKRTYHALIDEVMSSPRQLLNAEEAKDVEEQIFAIMGFTAGILRSGAEHGILQRGEDITRVHLLWAASHGIQHMKKRDGRVPQRYKSPQLIHALQHDLLHSWGADPVLVEDGMAVWSELAEQAGVVSVV